MNTNQVRIENHKTKENVILLVHQQTKQTYWLPRQYIIALGFKRKQYFYCNLYDPKESIRWAIINAKKKIEAQKKSLVK